MWIFPSQSWEVRKSDDDDDNNNNNKISGLHEIKELQKNSHIGYCTQTSQSANVKVQNISNMRNNISWSTNSEYGTAATLHTLETWFVLGV
jgi:hypothetical protein